ncbi:MAG: hypothetical protein GX425_05345 [Peptococcaceae bacterium]|nr:hypothetical protein [Peptococcaceae bacterium]
MLLEQPVEIAGHVNESLEMQIYGFDKSMAPEGKGVIKVELVSSYSYWKKLYRDRALYEEEKARVGETVKMFNIIGCLGVDEVGASSQGYEFKFFRVTGR